MSLKVFGSNVCPGTMRFLSILTANKVIKNTVKILAVVLIKYSNQRRSLCGTQ